MMLLTIIIVLLSLGILTILCAGLWSIFEKAGKEGWKALIPGYNLVELLDIIGLPWWSVFFLLIPIIPWIIVAFELGACFKKSKVWSILLMPPFFFIGIPVLGFSEARFIRPVDVTRTERVFTKFLKFALYFMIVVLINIIGVQLFLRLDLTDIGMYSLSKASKQAVATLQEPLTVRAFFSSNLPAEYLDLQQYVQDMFEEYAINGGKNFNYRFYDVGGEGELSPEQESNRDLAQEYGIYPTKIQIYKNDTFIFREAFMGIVIIHGDVVETLAQVTSKEKLEYNITSTIQKMNNKISALLALEDTIKVKLFLSSDFFSMLQSLTDVPDIVEGIVEELNKENYNKLEYIQIDPSKEPDLFSQEKALDPKSFKFRTGNEDSDSYISLYADLIIQYGENVEKYNFLELFNTPWGLQPNLADEDTFKEVISETVTNIIDINEYIGYIADHGSARLQYEDMELQAMMQMNPNLNVPKITANNFKEVLSEHYTLKEINLGEDGRIPKGIECLVIAGPRSQFSDWELFQIDQFLMQGKSIALFYDGLEEKQPEMNRQLYGYQMPKQYPPVQTGLENLLEHYGVAVKNSYVMDEHCLTQPSQQYGNVDIYFIPEIQTNGINNKLAYMRNIKGLLMIQASPIKLYEDKLKENNIKADILVSSSPQSWELTENISLDNPMAIMPPSSPEEKQAYPLAVTLEGKFTSYFKGKPIPQKPRKETTGDEEQPEDADIFSETEISDEINVIEEAKAPGRIFVVGTSEIIRDLILNYVPPSSLRDTSPNKIFVSNVIDYCNGKEDYAAMRSKLQLVNPLDETKATPFIKDFTEYFNLIGLPIIAIILGVIIFLGRVARKKQIFMRFSPKGAAVATEETVDKKALKSVVSKGLQFSKDYLALVIVVGLLLCILLWTNISRRMGVIRYKLPTLEAIQEDSIDKIVVTKDDRVVTIEKGEDDKWFIMPEGYPVDPYQSKSMVEKVSNLTIAELISRQKQYDRYELDDDNKLIIQAYSGSTVIRTFEMGKAASATTQTYVALSDDSNIYSAQGNLRSIFDKKASEMRDEKVLSYNKGEINEIILEFEDQSIIITKQKAGEGEEEKDVWMSTLSDVPVPENSMNDILNTMGNLVCEEFYTDTTIDDLKTKPFLYKITARGSKDYILTIYDPVDENKYPAYSSESDYAFELIGWRATKMMKKLSDIQAKETDN